MQNAEFMREAIRLANEAVNKGNHPFGAVLVHSETIILSAENTVNTEHDVTNHAEINLVRQASRQFDATFLNDCTLYASTEPCAMCSGAIFWSGIKRVVYGCSAKHLYEIAGGGSLPVPCQEILGRGQPPGQIIGPFLEAEAVQLHLTYWNHS